MKTISRSYEKLFQGHSLVAAGAGAAAAPTEAAGTVLPSHVVLLQRRSNSRAAAVLPRGDEHSGRRAGAHLKEQLISIEISDSCTEVTRTGVLQAQTSIVLCLNIIITNRKYWNKDLTRDLIKDRHVKLLCFFCTLEIIRDLKFAERCFRNRNFPSAKLNSVSHFTCEEKHQVSPKARFLHRSSKIQRCSFGNSQLLAAEETL